MLKPMASQPPIRQRPVRVRPVRVRAGPALALLTIPLLLPGCAPRTTRTPTAWQEAPLARERPPADDPVTLSLWANALSPLLQRGERLGPPPRRRPALLQWLAAQCRINRLIQEVQRRHGKPVDAEQDLGRPSYCHDLAVLRRRF